MKVETFNKHLLSTILMCFYFLWWLMVCSFFESGSSQRPTSCGAANGALVILSLFLSGIYFVGLVIRRNKLKKEDVAEYGIFFKLLFLIPLALILFFN